MSEHFRNNLKALRLKADLTQGEVAKEVGITRAFYGMIENGERNPTLHLAMKISSFFNLSVEEIFAVPLATDEEKMDLFVS